LTACGNGAGFTFEAFDELRVFHQLGLNDFERHIVPN
jgi:hypothetical protein